MEDRKKEIFDNVHWADNSAQRVLNEFPDEKIYTVASGITPSGIVHVGHFREIITSELVRRALEKKGKKTKFIYSWDSYDAFRKVPKNVPENWDKYLRLPDASVPDPLNCHESFAEHYMQNAESSLKIFNFPIEFQRQHEIQTSGIYADGIKNHLSRIEEIRDLINKHRPKDRPLADNWFPLELYCEKCSKDTVKISDYDNEYSLSYKCQCGNENRINFKETPIVKLGWRLDWPMRWNHYHVTFEPGGKDHSTPGGSYDTGCDIIKLISNRSAPVYTFYNFVGMKGIGGKISSSTGDGATIADVLKIYTPELVMFLFAGTRPNAEFDISFDLDVIKIYEDFDKLERLYYGLEEEKNEKKLATQKRIYELCMIENKIQNKMPFQPSFRHLLSVAQGNDFDFEKVKEFYKTQMETKYELQRLKERFECARNWLKEYAPDDMVFSFKDKLNTNLSESEKNILLELKHATIKYNDTKDLMNEFKLISQRNSIEIKDFFKLSYLVIIGKEKGPRLPNLILENKDKILKLLNQIN